MKCFRPWTEQFIVTNLNRSFVDKQLAPHRKQVILEKELARIPETMEAAEKYKLCQEEEDKIAVLAKEIKQLRDLINLKTSQQYTHRMNINKIKKKSNEKRDFIMPCPNEDCRGFLSKQYFCSICKMHTCPRCVEIIGFSKNEPHTCDENKVASAELIKKETKPGPACGERIYYVSGCDQMVALNLIVVLLLVGKLAKLKKVLFITLTIVNIYELLTTVIFLEINDITMVVVII